MDMKDLRGRLDSIKKNAVNEEKIAPETPPKPEIPPTEEVLLENGWEKTAEMVFEKKTVLKNILPNAISNILLRDFNLNDESVDGSLQFPAPKFLFYDTETTGLSAGAGNMVFLAGFGEVIDDCAAAEGTASGFRITQIFLSDFPGEAAFLERLKDFISPDRIYVSYNGKSFDANVLRTRFTMNAMQAEFGFQLDLLYSSRRLWKNIIGSCSLGDIERRVLDKHRALDVPGFMVPDLYFDFIRSGRWETIEGVLAHHLEDISSLAELLAVHEQLFHDASAEPVESSFNDDISGHFDPMGLSSILAAKAPEAAASVLERSFDQGNHRAGIELSLLYKRNRDWPAAVTVWKRLWISTKSIFAGIELAKYYEHHTKELEKAIEITDILLSTERLKILPYIDELKKRRNRLEAKLSKQS